MKFNVLRSIGHNIADSLASGESMLTGQYGICPFEEAGRSSSGFIRVDFLTGTSLDSFSPSFIRAVALYRAALLELCGKHGTSPLSFRRLEAKYISDVFSKRFFVFVEDYGGRSSTDEYAAHGGRFRVLDPLGRICRKRGPVTRVCRDGRVC